MVRTVARRYSWYGGPPVGWRALMAVLACFLQADALGSFDLRHLGVMNDNLHNTIAKRIHLASHQFSQRSLSGSAGSTYQRS